ncbi:MAG: mannitol dehydrogenase family protein [Microthrixaceae bacterium]
MRAAGLPRLSGANFADLAGARLPAYDRTSAVSGIVHLGLGAFARGHTARYCDDLLALGEPAAMTGVSLRSGSSTGPLAEQDGLYTLIETDGTNPNLRVIASVNALANGPVEAIDAIASPSTRAVTMTITEKGYHRAPGGGIDHGDPSVIRDLARPMQPTTAPGVLVEALRRRRDGDLGGLAVVSCDNLPANGSVISSAVLELAAARDTGLADWIAEHISFPSTVVDRIVPASTEADRQLVADLLGRLDQAPVRAEEHCSWVIERAHGLPAWDRVGARLVDDIAPWEQRKLRTVNGPHSALAYLGALAGHATIDAAANDPDLSDFVRALIREEVVPTLVAFDDSSADSADPGDAASYAAAVADATLDRFRNPALGHLCEQVAADGSQKLPQRIVEVIGSRRAMNEGVERSGLVIAAWIAWVLWCRRGKARLNDPMAPELLEVAATAGSPGSAGTSLAEAFLGIESIFAPAVASDPVVRSAVSRGLSLIDELGPAGAARSLVS